jgi:hypothetical protein
VNGSPAFQAPAAAFPDQFRHLGVTSILWRLGRQQLLLYPAKPVKHCPHAVFPSG